MTDADLTLRDEVAEVLCRGTGDRQCINYDRDVEGGCSWCTRDADALLPLLARVREEGRAEALRSPYDEDGYCEFCGNHCGKAHSPVCGWADLRDARAEGEARVRERVKAVLARNDEWVRKCLEVGAQGAAAVRVADIRAALAEPTGEAE